MKSKLLIRMPIEVNRLSGLPSYMWKVFFEDLQKRRLGCGEDERRIMFFMEGSFPLPPKLIV